jgi:hypothetical protein
VTVIPPTTERVQAGAAFLDEERPDWRWEIDTATLDLSDDCGCVLGQIFGDFTDGFKALGITASQAADLGFDSQLRHQDTWYDGRLRDVDHEYNNLTEEWRYILG